MIKSNTKRLESESGSNSHHNSDDDQDDEPDSIRLDPKEERKQPLMQGVKED